jgi:hypothetical protein
MDEEFHGRNQPVDSFDWRRRRIAAMSSAGDSGAGGFLSEKKGQSEGRSWIPWVIAGVVVLVVIGALVLSSHHQRTTSQQAETASQTPDAYASQLSIGNLQMSEASNFTGSKVTYLDGVITNKGDKTVNGVYVVVTFHNDIGEPPQKTPMPLSLIRTREPYVDIEPVSAEPLKPGDSHEFRLIFDHVSPTWNQQYPTVQPTRVLTR